MELDTNFFDQPLVRRFTATTLVLLGVGYAIYLLLQQKMETQLQLIFFELIYLAPLIWFVIVPLHRRHFGTLFSGLKPGDRPWSTWLIMLLITMPTVIGIDYLISLGIAGFAPSYIEQAINLEVIEPSESIFYNSWMLFTAVLLAPFMEEVVFRGLILERFSRKFGNRRAILISSLLFGMLHFEAIVGATLFGVVMCLVYIHTQNLWVPIVLHALNNAIAVFLTWQDGYHELTLAEFRSDWLIYLLCCLALPGFIAMVRYLWPTETCLLPFAQQRLR